jgi:hypothetical protein
VAKTEDDKPNLDDMISPDDMVLPDDAFAPSDQTPVDAAPIEMEAEPAPVEDEQPKGPAPAFDDGFEPETQPPYLAIAGVIAIPIALLAIAFFGILNFSTAIYIIGLVIVSLMLWMGRKTNTVFTVLLGCVLIALMTSIYCHWDFLMKKYHGDVKAQEAKQRVGMAQPVVGDVMRC